MGPHIGHKAQAQLFAVGAIVGPFVLILAIKAGTALLNWLGAIL